MTENFYKTPESELKNEEAICENVRLKTKSLFKLIFVGFLFGLGPLIILNGIYAMVVGSSSIVSFNGAKLSGVEGFVGTLVFAPLISFILAVFVWFFVGLGCLIYTRFWNLNLKLKL